MLPLLILVVPPTAIGGGYLSWSAGQKLVLATASSSSSTSSSSTDDEAPPNTLASNVAGLAALAGTYGAAEYFMGQSESSGGAAQGSGSTGSGNISKSGTSTATATGNGTIKKGPSVAGSSGGGKFVQPKSVGDLLSRIGPPVLMRLGAASFAFFCAGAVQTVVASKSLAKEERRQTKQK